MHKKTTFSIILLVCIAALSGCTIPLEKFEYAGDKDPVTVPQGTHTKVILDFKVGVGTITLEVNPTANYLAYIENEVSIREGSGTTLDDAEEVSYAEQNTEIMNIQFDSKDEGIEVDYGYDLTIKVCNNITLQIDFQGSVSEISTTITDATIAITSLDIQTSTGNIEISLGNVQFSDSSPTISSSTGNNDITLSNLNYSTSTTWDITASTGTIEMDITDSIVPITPLSISMTYTFDVTGSTGSISITADLHQDHGLKITTSVSTGDVTIPGGEKSYTSANYNAAIRNYEFDLSISTGDITFSSK
ncbi:MAG: hypothetical protein JSW11_08185 [Candidatus Heimdallarchaeota archaeon]|nr:MAG: hypothetical protein JSW11_08185 [Candidatus Heimdallarchaeota archaeon]